MSTANQPPEPPESSRDDSPTLEEFAEWLKSDPANLDHVANVARRVVAGEYGEVAPELVEQSRQMVLKHQTARTVKQVQEKLAAFKELMSQPPGTMLAEDRLAQANAIVNEATDVMLDLPEPLRTRHMKQLLPIRDFLRNYKFPET